MSKNNNFIMNCLIIGIAIFAIVSLILFRVKVSQLQDNQEVLSSINASCSERIAELEELLKEKE